VDRLDRDLDFSLPESEQLSQLRVAAGGGLDARVDGVLQREAVDRRLHELFRLQVLLRLGGIDDLHVADRHRRWRGLLRSGLRLPLHRGGYTARRLLRARSHFAASRRIRRLLECIAGDADPGAHRAGIALLQHVRELVPEERAPLLGAGPIGAGAEHDVRARRERLRVHLLGRARRLAVAMDPHVAEIAAELRFQLGAIAGVERLARSANAILCGGRQRALVAHRPCVEQRGDGRVACGREQLGDRRPRRAAARRPLRRRSVCRTRRCRLPALAPSARSAHGLYTPPRW
jgi:hypothetical protein